MVGKREFRRVLQDLREHGRVENHGQHRSARVVVSDKSVSTNLHSFSLYAATEVKANLFLVH